MPLAVVASRALAGIEAPEVTVEVHLGPGLPAFHIVGLPDAEVREAKDRVVGHWMTMGMLLSLPMVLAGAVMIMIAYRRG